MTALLACAPLQIYLAQRALIDGYFAFWSIAALWLAWENLQRPRHWGWLSAYTLCLTILVLTKENAAFVVFAIFGVLLLNRLLRLGTLTPQLLAATMLGPALGVLILAALVGGIWEWVEFYRMFVAKSRTNFYSILAQDGPWYRYAVDFVIISPLVCACACGGVFRLGRRDRAGLFLTLFLLLSLAAMSLVRYGISLRYAAFCDLPIAWLACAQVLALSRRLAPRRAAFVATISFLLLGRRRTFPVSTLLRERRGLRSHHRGAPLVVRDGEISRRGPGNKRTSLTRVRVDPTLEFQKLQAPGIELERDRDGLACGQVVAFGKLCARQEIM